MFVLRISLAFLLVSLVLGHGHGGYGGGYSAEYDCGGSCGGGCGYGNPCGNSAPAQYVVSSGCSTGECGGGGGGGGHSSRYSSGSSSGYHKSETTITKESSQSSLKILVGKPVVHRTTYVQPQPVVHRTTYIDQPEPQPQRVVYKKQRYVDEADYGTGCGSGCDGGGSKIVKIIKKTTYGSAGDGCSTCAAESYTGDVEYSQPTVVRKVTRIVTQPKVVRVIKTVVNQEAPSGEYYEDSGSSYGGQPQGGYHHKQNYGGGGGGARAKAGAFAFASASASAGAGAGGGGGQSGEYIGGGGGGCKSGCDQWKK